jgi:uncharacterized membrane protein
MATIDRVNAPARETSKAGILMGIGLGGFVDGIVLHQILQWHNMLSHQIPPITMESMKINMTADGLFHALMWFFTMAGIFMLWSGSRRGIAMPAAVAFIGQLILGWGIFNLVEGLVNHQILGLHHVREVPEFLVYDLAFLLIGGAGLIVLGLFLIRRNS